MPISEVFKRPTVKQVIFQITYPNLFYLESKIGDFQLKIIDKFPESALLFRRQVLFADLGLSEGAREIMEKEKQEKIEQGTRKIWRFNSPLGYQLNVMTDSLDITSQLHKTYNNRTSDNRFRDIIEYVVKSFLDLTNIPKIVRIGLRYVDECPVPNNKTEDFLSYYNTVFPVTRFRMEDSIEMNYSAVVKRDDCYIRYVESFKQLSENKFQFIMDFDGFAQNIDAQQYLTTADKLHDLIAFEYEATIKEPVYRYMRGE